MREEDAPVVHPVTIGRGVEHRHQRLSRPAQDVASAGSPERGHEAPLAGHAHITEFDEEPAGVFGPVGPSTVGGDHRQSRPVFLRRRHPAPRVGVPDEAAVHIRGPLRTHEPDPQTIGCVGYEAVGHKPDRVGGVVVGHEGWIVTSGDEPAIERRGRRCGRRHSGARHDCHCNGEREQRDDGRTLPPGLDTRHGQGLPSRAKTGSPPSSAGAGALLDVHKGCPGRMLPTRRLVTTRPPGGPGAEDSNRRGLRRPRTSPSGTSGSCRRRGRDGPRASDRSGGKRHTWRDLRRLSAGCLARRSLPSRSRASRR